MAELEALRRGDLSLAEVAAPIFVGGERLSDDSAFRAARRPVLRLSVGERI